MFSVNFRDIIVYEFCLAEDVLTILVQLAVVIYSRTQNITPTQVKFPRFFFIKKIYISTAFRYRIAKYIVLQFSFDRFVT